MNKKKPSDISCFFVYMICLATKYNLVNEKKTIYILTLELDYCSMSRNWYLHLKVINLVQKWPQQSTTLMISLFYFHSVDIYEWKTPAMSNRFQLLLSFIIGVTFFSSKFVTRVLSVWILDFVSFQSFYIILCIEWKCVLSVWI